MILGGTTTVTRWCLRCRSAPGIIFLALPIGGGPSKPSNPYQWFFSRGSLDVFGSQSQHFQALDFQVLILWLFHERVFFFFSTYSSPNLRDDLRILTTFLSDGLKTPIIVRRAELQLWSGLRKIPWQVGNVLRGRKGDDTPWWIHLIGTCFWHDCGDLLWIKISCSLWLVTNPHWQLRSCIARLSRKWPGLQMLIWCFNCGCWWCLDRLFGGCPDRKHKNAPKLLEVSVFFGPF